MKSIVIIIYFALLIFQLAALWKVFVKSGRPGWASIIPFYNIYVFLQIGGKPGWWLLLVFVPLVQIVFCILANVGVANNFGKGTGFAIGLTFLPIIFLPILAFSNAQYTG